MLPRVPVRPVSPRRPGFLQAASALAALALLASGVAGCGSSDPDPQATAPPRPATLLLDFAPNAVHAGTYLTVARKLDRRAGVRLTVRAPASSTDAVKLLKAGRAQFAYIDIHDLALADAKGAGLVGVMALVQHPLAAVLADPSISRPRELEGRDAGVTGLPSDDAVLSSIVAGDGGDPARVKRVTIGFEAVPALLARRVSAATGFWNAEGVALRARRPRTQLFKVDDYGAPAYPELVLAVTRDTLRDDPKLVRATVAALRRGYAAAIADPEAALTALTDGARGIDARQARRELRALASAFTTKDGTFGVLDPAVLARWSAWEAKFGITERPPDVGELFAPAFSRSG